MRAIFDHWVSKDIRRRAKFILKHIEDWKAAREKQALGAAADKKNTPDDAGGEGECCQMDAAR